MGNQLGTLPVLAIFLAIVMLLIDKLTPLLFADSKLILH